MPEPLPNLRLFISLPVPTAVKTAISATQEELRRLMPRECVRWAPPEQWHLTLRFLGNVAGDQVAGLTGALQAACQGIGLLALRAEGIGFFPNLHRPRVIWVGVPEPTGRLQQLWSVVQQASASFTKEQPENEFVGHITLGRVKFLKGQPAKLLAQAGQRLADITFGDWTADAVELMQSVLSQQGARHSCIATVGLTPSRLQ